jgi:DNA repair protein RecN (Recombination protein N)
MNPEALAELNTRLNLVNTLLIKHQVQTVEELVSIRDEYAKEQNLAENLEEHIKEQLQYITKRRNSKNSSRTY